MTTQKQDRYDRVIEHALFAIERLREQGAA